MLVTPYVYISIFSFSATFLFYLFLYYLICYPFLYINDSSIFLQPVFFPSFLSFLIFFFSLFPILFILFWPLFFFLFFGTIVVLYRLQIPYVNFVWLHFIWIGNMLSLSVYVTPCVSVYLCFLQSFFFLSFFVTLFSISSFPSSMTLFVKPVSVSISFLLMLHLCVYLN